MKLSTVGLLVSFLVLVSCGKKSGPSATPGVTPLLDGMPRKGVADNYEGIYKVNLQKQTKFNNCDEEVVVGLGERDYLDYFKLETYQTKYGDEDVVQLWAKSCENATKCENQIMNFYFDSKDKEVWSGITVYSLSPNPTEVGKCNISYLERIAVKNENAISMISTTYSGVVSPLKGAECPKGDLYNEEVKEMFIFYHGKLNCSERQTIYGTKQ